LADLAALQSAFFLNEEALESKSQALSVLRELHDREGEGVTLSNIAKIYSSLDSPLKAIDFYNQAQVIFKEVGDKRDDASTLNHIGNVYLRHMPVTQLI
jgi:tetratricopeptide (TPR) repeat protein